EPPPGYPRRYYPRGDTALTTTAADGRFRFAHLPDGRFTLEARAEGYSPGTVRGLAVAAGAAPLELGTVVLQAGATLAGRVLDERQQPVVGATIHLADGAMEHLHGSSERPPGPDDEVSGADGAFALRDLTAGQPVELEVTKSGFLPQTVNGVAATSAEPVRIVLKAAARLVGRVVDESGEPVARASVHVTPEQGTLFGLFGLVDATTEADGRFTVEGLRPGKAVLRAAAEGFLASEPIQVEAIAGQERAVADLALRRGASLAGVVYRADGTPVASSPPGARTCSRW
ncbi:MAG TPA: carboxypeptidase-like regulatory domain-containing protein, partial [Thermoanaerobaculia bacterium]